MDNPKEFIFYEKDGIMKEVRRPEYGDITIKFRNGEVYSVRTGIDEKV